MKFSPIIPTRTAQPQGWNEPTQAPARVASEGYATDNFRIYAPDSMTAIALGNAAERARKEKAMLWLGKEMPRWGSRLPIHVELRDGGNGGSTTFAFGDNRSILSQSMKIMGSRERLAASVLPHEITHTVLAYHFRRPIPRWADEGAAVLEEDAEEHARQESMLQQVSVARQTYQLRELFVLTNYPPDTAHQMALYAQGFSVTRWLVGKSDRTTFLAFVQDGLGGAWDEACQRRYGYDNVDVMEREWKAACCPWLRGPVATRPAPKSPSVTGPVVITPAAGPDLRPIMDALASVQRDIAELKSRPVPRDGKPGRDGVDGKPGEKGADGQRGPEGLAGKAGSAAPPAELDYARLADEVAKRLPDPTMQINVLKAEITALRAQLNSQTTQYRVREIPGK